jgi:hypothetical protein
VKEVAMIKLFRLIGSKIVKAFYDEIMNPMSPLMVTLIVIACTGAFIGFFVTYFWPMDEAGWKVPVIIRVSWHIGGFSLLSLRLALQYELFREWRGRVLMFFIGTLIGFLLSFNPVLDLVEGPVSGYPVSSGIFKGTGHSGRYGTEKTISAAVDIQTADGKIIRFRPVGLRANIWEYFLAQTPEGRRIIKLTILRHQQVPLSVAYGNEQLEHGVHRFN